MYDDESHIAGMLCVVTEVTERVIGERLMPELRDTRVIAVTGYGQQQDRAQAKAAGFDEHLVKPVSPASVARALAGIPQTARDQ